MASAFGHAAAAFAISRFGMVQKPVWPLLVLGIFASILPDADSIGFKFGVPYDSFWGHRGFTHSIVFALLVAIVFTTLFYFRSQPGQKLLIALYLFLCCISHAILDAMTNGGLGVAFFSPFNNHRYFFGFRPIKVSPISVAEFFKGRGLIVMKSEAVWIGIPTLCIYVITVIWNLAKRKKLD